MYAVGHRPLALLLCGRQVAFADLSVDILILLAVSELMTEHIYAAYLRMFPVGLILCNQAEKQAWQWWYQHSYSTPLL